MAIAIRVLIAGLSGLLLTVAAFAADDTALSQSYRDDENGFTIQYPEGWEPAHFRDGPTFQVIADEMKGPLDCSVNVTGASGADQLHSETQEGMRNALARLFKNPVITEWRMAKLAGRDALRFTFQATIKDYLQTTLSVHVVVGGRLYALSCNAPTDLFPTSRPLFERIIASIAFH
jgi:hypothetical protein